MCLFLSFYCYVINSEILEPKFAEKFQSILPRSTLTWIEDAGHIPHVEQPQITSQAILDFLQK